MQRLASLAAIAAVSTGSVMSAYAQSQPSASDKSGLQVAAICGLIDSAARAQGLPVSFLSRLIWQESAFHAGAVSPAGASGIAQFMPGTANARGLADPFDPESAIPEAAKLLAELRTRFGNWGLAAAAYNSGAGSVGKFIAGQADLPQETKDYVSIVTGHSVEEWRAPSAAKFTDQAMFPESSCVQVIAAARRDAPKSVERSPFLAPWGVELSSSFDKGSALRAFAHSRALYWTILGGIQPMIIGVQLPGRGPGLFYRVRAPAQTRERAELMCDSLKEAGVTCAVLKN
jgi:hypothetical protein